MCCIIISFKMMQLMSPLFLQESTVFRKSDHFVNRLTEFCGDSHLRGNLKVRGNAILFILTKRNRKFYVESMGSLSQGDSLSAFAHYPALPWNDDREAFSIHHS